MMITIPLGVKRSKVDTENNVVEKKRLRDVRGIE